MIVRKKPLRHSTREKIVIGPDEHRELVQSSMDNAGSRMVKLQLIATEFMLYRDGSRPGSVWPINQTSEEREREFVAADLN